MRSVLSLTLAFVSGVLSAAEPPPNVVVIFIDDQGYADLGCFGAKGYQTPNLDKLASEGRRFTNFHVAQPVCSASRAALLTGCYPNRIGIHGALGPKSKVGLSTGETTMAEMLKAKGYATCAVGKWHLGDEAKFLPIHHGFDEYLGLPYSNDMWPLPPGMNDLPKDSPKRRKLYPDLPMIEGDQVIDPEVTAEEQKQLTTRYTERAVSFIDRNKDKPFFLYLAHSMVHVPLFVSDKFAGKSGAGLFGDVTMEVDWSVGQVMDALNRNGLSNKTLVVYTSDNGPWLNFGDHAGSAAPLREGKGTNWEGGTRVPCIMRWPGKIPAGSGCDTVMGTIDLFPTIAAITGGKLPDHKIDGLDVAPLIFGNKDARNPHEAYYWYYNQNELQGVTSGDGRWKLYLPHAYRTLAGKPAGKGGFPVNYSMHKVEKPELYDLTNDISESTDVSDKHPEIVQQLLALAEKARVDLGDAATNRKGSGNRPPGRSGNQGW
jgi:arylsulfatase